MDKFTKTFLAVALLVAGNAFAAPKADQVAQTEGFATEAAAATAGVTAAAQIDIFDECGGVVFQSKSNDLFYYSTPICTGDLKGVTFAIVKVAGYKAVAIWHTHPNGQSHNTNLAKFSPEDVTFADSLKGANSYIGVVKGINKAESITMKVYHKGDAKDCQTELSVTACYADGTEI